MKSIYRSLMAAATILFFSSAMIHAAGDGPEFDAKKQKWGFREASGKWKVKPQFSKVTKLPEGGYLVEKEGKKGYFNGACEKVASTDFDTLAVGHTGYVMVCREGRWGLVAPNGKTTIKPRYATMKMTPTGMLCVSEKGFGGIVDTENKEILPLVSYTTVEPFSTEFLLFRRGEECGLLDQGGHEKIRGGRYASYTADGDDFIMVTSYGKTGMLDGHGNEIIAPLNDSISRWLDRYFLVETMGKKGVYSLEGRPLIPSQYDSIEPVNEALNRFILTFGNKKGLSSIDEMILPCEFSAIKVLPSGELKAVRQGVANLYTSKGKPAYTREEPVGDGLRAMSNDTTQFMIVDSAFNSIVPLRRGHIAESHPLILIAGTGDLPILLNPGGKKLLEAVIPVYEMADDTDEFSVFFNHQPIQDPSEGRFTVFDRKGNFVSEYTLMESRKLCADSTGGDERLKIIFRRLLPKLESLYASSQSASGKTVTFNKMWIKDNASRGGERGLEVHLSFNISGARYDKCVAEAYFLDSDGNALLDRDGKFADADGLVRATATFIPEDESSDISDLGIFMPYKQLHVSTSSRVDGWVVVVIECDGEVLATSDFFNYTVAGGKTSGKTPKFRRSFNRGL